MPRETTLRSAAKNLVALCDQVTSDHDVIFIRRRGADNVALIAAAELSSLLETAHLLRSPKSVRRLLNSLHRANEQIATAKPSQ
jgi:antitoxin YefM